MNSTGNKTITIDKKIQGLTTGPLEVNYKETTDGAPFYECTINGQNIQLRKDEKWVVIWGDLPEEQVQQLGTALDDQITKP